MRMKMWRICAFWRTYYCYTVATDARGAFVELLWSTLFDINSSASM